MASKKVSYKKREDVTLVLPIPLEKAVNQGTLSFYLSLSECLKVLFTWQKTGLETQYNKGPLIPIFLQLFGTGSYET